MPLHLVKLCVGPETIEDLAHRQKNRLAQLKKDGLAQHLVHKTYQMPKRRDELLDGGSIYWVIKGNIQVRQKLIGIEAGVRNDGRKCCDLIYLPELVATRPMPRRAFQGWRYILPEDAPKDLPKRNARGANTLSPQMQRDLIELGLL